jgi:hypothetical protein
MFIQGVQQFSGLTFPNPYQCIFFLKQVSEKEAKADSPIDFTFTASVYLSTKWVKLDTEYWLVMGIYNIVPELHRHLEYDKQKIL